MSSQRQYSELKDTPYPIIGDIDDPAAWCSFSCTIESSQCAAGEIIVLWVAGEVDLCTIPILYSALDKCLGQCAAYLVVDLTRTTFCSAHGLDLLTQTRRIATTTATGYAVTGAPAHIQRFWILGWSGDVLPIRYHSTAAALTAIRAAQPVTA
jgi:anti-anti-sigma regulatory factor